MADTKVTKMVIKVDLQCSKCYRKIKKVLCRYPEIHDQVYDEKKSTVTITVVCCSPEYIKQKIACKAGDTLESIEIVPYLKPILRKKVRFIEGTKPPASASAPAPARAPKTPAPASAPKAPVPAPATKPPAPARVPPPKVREPGPVVMGFPVLPPPGPVPIYPVGVCCCCYKGGPCYHGGGPMCYDGCGQPLYQCSGGNRGYYVSRCNEYFSEDNTSGCSVM